MYPEIYGHQMVVLCWQPVQIDPSLPSYVTVCRLQIPSEWRRHVVSVLDYDKLVTWFKATEDRPGQLLQPARFWITVGTDHIHDKAAHST